MHLLALQFYRLWVFYSAIFCSLNFCDAFVLPPFYLSIIRQLHPVMTLLQVNSAKILASYFRWYYLTKCCSSQYAVSHCFSDGRSRERTNYRLISPSRMIGAKIVWRKAQAVKLRAQIISDGDKILHHKILYSWEWTTKRYCRTKSLIWKAWAILDMFVSRRYKVVKLLLEQDLLWESCWNNPNYLPRRSLEWRAPTWSWASVKGTIRYRLLDVTPEYKDHKPTSGITSPSDNSSAGWRSAWLGHSRINMA